MATGDLGTHLLQSRLRHRFLLLRLDPYAIPSSPRLSPFKPAGHPVAESTKNLPMQGFITHVSNLYIMTYWTTDKLMCPNVWASAPYSINTLVSCAHFCCALQRLLTTIGQSSSASDRILPIYLKEVIAVRGIAYAVIIASDPTCASSSTRQHCFLYSTHR